VTDATTGMRQEPAELSAADEQVLRRRSIISPMIAAIRSSLVAKCRKTVPFPMPARCAISAMDGCLGALLGERLGSGAQQQLPVAYGISPR
jgi:hypothetical protein